MKANAYGLNSYYIAIFLVDVIVVGSSDRASVDMNIRRDQSLITFTDLTSAAAVDSIGSITEPSVVMNITDMISHDRLTLNQTHLVYGDRGESLLLPGNAHNNTQILIIHGDQYILLFVYLHHIFEPNTPLLKMNSSLLSRIVYERCVW